MKIKYLSLLIFLPLIGCDQQHKERIQSSLNRYDDHAVCFNLGMPDSIYPIDIINVPKPNYFEYDFEKEHQAFATFAQLGLLEEKELTVTGTTEDSTVEGYRYSVTDAGKAYSVQNGFCFGRVELHEIIRSEDIEYRQFDLRVDTGKRIYYTYSFHDIPEWAKAPELAELYDRTIKFDGRLYNGTATTSDKKGTYSTSVKSTLFLRD